MRPTTDESATNHAYANPVHEMNSSAPPANAAVQPLMRLDDDSRDCYVM
jgi:hypothetical protein